jgi:hypothetical protein
MDYRVRGHWHDPYWNYYRWRHRDNPRWEDDYRQRYVARRDNRAARPPRTLAEQQRVGGKQQQVMVTRLDQINVNNVTNVKLRPVTKVEVQQIQKNVQNVKSLQKQRNKVETQARAVGGAANKQAVKVQLPKAKGDGPPRVKGKSAAPPRPNLPKVQAQAPAGKKAPDDGQPDPLPKKGGGKKIDAPPKKAPPKIDLPKGKGADAPPPKAKPKPKPKDDDPDPKPLPKPKVRPKDDDPDPRPLPKPKVDAPKPKIDVPKRVEPPPMRPKLDNKPPPQKEKKGPPAGKDPTPPGKKKKDDDQARRVIDPPGTLVGAMPAILAHPERETAERARRLLST